MTHRKLKNILVTGGAGFIGSAFVRLALNKPKFSQGKLVNLDALTYAGNLENLSSIEQNPNYHFVKGTILDQALVEKICTDFSIDTIIHFAAESHVDRSIHSPESFIETNVIGTFRLLEVVRKFPHIHFHHVSTDEVYGCLGDSGYFIESTPYHPNSPYSASKASSDHFVRAYAHTYGLSTCISNCSNNYGPYQFPEKLIPLMLLNASEGKSLPIYGEGKNVRDWLHVEDHVEALWLLLENGVKGETYNIGGGAERKNIEIVHTLIQILSELTNKPKEHYESLITYVKDRPGHDFRYAIDCNKISQTLGWKPLRGFEAGLRETVQWYLNHLDWVNNIRSGAYLDWINKNYKQR